MVVSKLIFQFEYWYVINENISLLETEASKPSFYEGHKAKMMQIIDIWCNSENGDSYFYFVPEASYLDMGEAAPFTGPLFKAPNTTRMRSPS